MKKIILFMISLCFFIMESNGQVFDSVRPIGRGALGDSVFAHVDKSQINTGILMDKAGLIFSPDAYRGDTLSDSTHTLDAFLGLYEQIYYGRVNNSYGSMRHPDSLYLKWMHRYDGTTAAISLLWAKFNRIAEQAVNDTPFFNLIDSQLYDNSHRVDSPYIADTIFSAALARTTFVEGKIDFIVPSEQLFVLGISSYTLQADFGTGDGWQTIIPDTIYHREYADSGSYVIKLKVTTGSVSAIALLNFSTEVDIGILPDPDFTWTDNVWNDPVFGKIQAEVFLAPGNVCIEKPIIFVEGFDPLDEFAIPDIRRILQQGNSNNPLSFYAQLMSNGYDVIILNFYRHGGDSIISNAQVLKRLIQWVNANKCTNEKLVVAGASMGALIARYALAQMELACEIHDTRLYISMDGPHQGANISLGLQYLTAWSEEVSLGLVSAVRNRYYSLSTPAAMQLIVSHWHTFGQQGNLRSDFQNAYVAMGYPEQCRNIAGNSGQTDHLIPE